MNPTNACGDVITIDNTTNEITPNPLATCRFGNGQIGVEWFSFVATADSVNINTCNSIAALGGNSTIALYSGPCTFANLVEIGCGEDECGPVAAPYLSEFDATGLTIGDTYFIQFSAWDADSRGLYTLDIICPSPPFGPVACCLSDGTCQFITEMQCIKLGLPQGPGTDCTDADSNGIADACENGACCEPNGDCTDTTNDLCVNVLGGELILGGNCVSDDGGQINQS